MSTAVEEHGALTRANGDRFRQIVLSRGSTENYAQDVSRLACRAPNIDAMKKDRGLAPRKPSRQISHDYVYIKGPFTAKSRPSCELLKLPKSDRCRTRD